MKSSSLCLAVMFLMLAGSQPAEGQKMVYGYVITTEGDSLNGYLSYRDIKYYRDSFLFSSDPENGNRRIFNASNCRAFGLFDPFEVFEKWTGTLDMSHINERYELYPDSVKNATIFMKNIYNGSSISLFHYYDVKDHFLVKHNGNVEELIQKYARPSAWQGMKSGRAPHHNLMQIYRKQLYRFFDPEKNRRLKIEVDFSNYNYTSLLNVVQWIDLEYSAAQKKKRN